MHIILTISILIICINTTAQKSGITSPSAEEVAKKLANPVSSLISVPLQSNIDYGIGPYNGAKYTLNIQPVVPINLTPKVNLITRYIVPVVDQHNIIEEGGNEFGLSDATVSGFFAPAVPKNGLMWGAGPAFLVPIGTNDYLSTRKWAIGPTAVVVKQVKGFTYGFLVNQLWSFAGDKDRSNINQLFLQPTIVHNWKSGAGAGVNAEITFNWEASTTIAFIIPTVSGVTKFGTQTISLTIGPRIPVTAPADGKTDFGFRGVLTFVFPK